MAFKARHFIYLNASTHRIRSFSIDTLWIPLALSIVSPHRIYSFHCREWENSRYDGYLLQ